MTSSTINLREITISVIANLLTSSILALGIYGTDKINIFHLSIQHKIILFSVGFLILLIANVVLFIKLYKMTSFKKIGLVAAISSPENKITARRYPKLIKNRDFCFLGISAHRILTEPEIVKVVERNSKDGFEIKFLLMHPDCTELKRRARNEGADHETFRSDIMATISRINTMREKGCNIKFKVVREVPAWRMLIFGKNNMLLTWFPDGKQGYFSDQLLLERQDEDCLFSAFFNHFNEIWNHRAEGYNTPHKLDQ